MTVTVAVSCNLSDGVILGVDSAVTVATAQGVAKVYENAEKLFQLGDRPIGIATYGMGAIGARTIGSYIREFEVRNPKQLTAKVEMKTVVGALREFFMSIYRQDVVPAVEKETGKKFDEIPPEEIRPLGLVVGGFSSGAYLSEVWEIIIPHHSTLNSEVCKRGQGNFGANWFAMFDPIRRYIKGFDPVLVDRLVDYLVKIRGGTPLTPEETNEVYSLLKEYEYPIPFGAMPIEEGINHVRSVIELVINHHRFATGAPVVGGQVQIGKVTYRGEKFEILEEDVGR